MPLIYIQVTIYLVFLTLKNNIIAAFAIVYVSSGYIPLSFIPESKGDVINDGAHTAWVM
ncbi:hypothetical protein BJ885_4351 [Enterobacter sp. WP_7_1]|nr:hypothetical protein BJ885_4351 [Enterobacter sp. WP_7_1]RMA87512.1 hypothetical protein BJ886_4468 [Enterobacter sp. WP_7_2]